MAAAVQSAAGGGDDSLAGLWLAALNRQAEEQNRCLSEHPQSM
jgi:hypothetical protein